MNTSTRRLTGLLLIACVIMFAGMVIAQRVHEVNNPMPVIELTADTTQIIVVPKDCEAVLSASKTQYGLMVTYESREGYERMAQYEYTNGKWVRTYTYLFARQK